MKVYHIQGLAQGTDYHITYFAKDSTVTKNDVEDLLAKIDRSMSLYKPESLINRFNQGQRDIQTDSLLNTVLQKSFTIYQETRGVFDITVAPLVQSWGFGPVKTSVTPDSAEIQSILKCVGMNQLRLSNGQLIKAKPCIQIDLNGIAQGYSVDLLAGLLQQHGINRFLVELGGEIRVAGPKPDGSPMKIGIEGPDINDQPVIRHVAILNQGAITTSGNYRKFHQYGKKRVSHLIDPRSGYPLENEMISVTVYAADAITADGYDNALMAMPIHEALKFVEQHPSIEAYFVYRKPDGAITDTLSTGFKKLLRN